MIRIAIIGAGLLGQQIAHYISSDQGFINIGFFDDFVTKLPTQEYGPLLGKVANVRELYSKGVFDQVIIGIGYKHFSYRWQCFEQLHSSVPFLTFIHSTCFVDKSAHIGDGSFLMPGTIVDDHAWVGENVFIQIGCSISHHSVIKDNCFLGPNVTVAGCVTVERDCFLGVGSVLIDSINVASGVMTGGGSVVTENLNETGLYVGIPARKIK